MARMPTLACIAQVEQILAETDCEVYVRWSRGPAKDAAMGGRSGDWSDPYARHAGLSAAPLRWAAGSRARLASALVEYRFCRIRDPEIYGWLCTGQVSGHDSDGQPTLVDVQPIARIGRALERQIDAHLVRVEPGMPRVYWQD